MPSDECCENSQVVLPRKFCRYHLVLPDMKVTILAEECKDFMEHCEIAQCDHVDFVEFARANCAKTCNFCFENATLPPG